EAMVNFLTTVTNDFNEYFIKRFGGMAKKDLFNITLDPVFVKNCLEFSAYFLRTLDIDPLINDYYAIKKEYLGLKPILEDDQYTKIVKVMGWDSKLIDYSLNGFSQKMTLYFIQLKSWLTYSVSSLEQALNDPTDYALQQWVQNLRTFEQFEF